ncbi:MAG: c-type cytochrome [Betaproteobacteria bacterium]
MKCVTVVVILALVVAFGAGIAFASSQEASAEKGKALFNDPKLGTSGKSCNTCHPDGKGLEKAGAKSDLESTINGCITIPLKGKALDVKSVEMQSLVLYIKSLGSKQPAATKKPAVGC